MCPDAHDWPESEGASKGHPQLAPRTSDRVNLPSTISYSDICIADPTRFGAESRPGKTLWRSLKVRPWGKKPWQKGRKSFPIPYFCILGNGGKETARSFHGRVELLPGTVPDG